MKSSLSQQSGIKFILEWSAKPARTRVFHPLSSSLEQYFQAIDSLHGSPRLGELMPVAMAQLECEFSAVLFENSRYEYNYYLNKYQAQFGSTAASSLVSSASSIWNYDDNEILNTKCITYLRCIVERLNLHGDLAKTVRHYKSERKNFLREKLAMIGFYRLKIGKDLRRLTLDELKLQIDLWIQISKICVYVLFQNEKQLSGLIFEGVGGSSVKDECFMETVQDIAVKIFYFPQAVGASNQLYARMETVLALDNAFWSILPDVEALFGSEQAHVITNGWSETLVGIENDVCRMLYDLKKAVLYEIPSFCDVRGGVHKTTKYVMDQMDLIMRNRGMLTTLIKSSPSTLVFDGWAIPQEDIQDISNRSFLEQHLILIIVVLRRNLERKAKGCNDSFLGNLFMMNNIRYIVLKMQGSHELQAIIGDSYMEKLNKDVKIAKNSFLDHACRKFLICLASEMNSTWCFSPGLSKFVLRRRLKAFNIVYEEIEASHPLCTVPDLQFKEQICRSMCEQLVPAYKNFLGKFTSNPERNEKNFKYSVQDLEALISGKLFTCTEDLVL